MRKVLCGVVMCLAILALATPSHPLPLDSWGQAFQTDYRPNVVNLYTTDPYSFSTATGLPSGWNYYQSADGSFAQLYTTGDFGLSNFIWTQWWWDPRPTQENPLYLDWQELHYDWTTGEITASWTGGLVKSSPWSTGPYGAAGGPDSIVKPMTATPEPSSLVLIGSAMILIGLYGRKRYQAKMVGQ